MAILPLLQSSESRAFRSRSSNREALTTTSDRIIKEVFYNNYALKVRLVSKIDLLNIPVSLDSVIRSPCGMIMTITQSDCSYSIIFKVLI